MPPHNSLDRGRPQDGEKEWNECRELDDHRSAEMRDDTIAGEGFVLLGFCY